MKYVNKLMSTDEKLLSQYNHQSQSFVLMLNFILSGIEIHDGLPSHLTIPQQNNSVMINYIILLLKVKL